MEVSLKQFQTDLSKLKSVSEDLDKKICQQNWSPFRKRHARLLVGQLPVCTPVSTRVEGVKKFSVLTPIELYLSPADCEIKYQAEREKMIAELCHYVEELLIDLSNLSKTTVRFYPAECDAKTCEYDKPCIFSIPLEC